MNERIRELAEQANANELSYAYYRGEKRPENAVTLHSVDLELFAELIVRECVEICRSEDWEDQQGWGKLYAHKIKKHFEVK